jgi:hypothetical protein
MATWRLRRKWRLRREAESTGRTFDTSKYERSESMANNTTWMQELLFAYGAPLLAVTIIALIGLAIYSLLGLLH